MKISRVKSPPNKETFKIKPIKRLLERYVGDGKGWVDPFAGNNSPAEFTNDLNPNTKAKQHIKSVEFCKKLAGSYCGVLFDPPYSPRQIKECYEGVGLKPSMKDTQNCLLYSETKKAIINKIKVGGYAITFGWNSNGFGKRMGFEIIEILLVSHSAAHNDTICVVERKVQTSLFRSEVEE